MTSPIQTLGVQMAMALVVCLLPTYGLATDAGDNRTETERSFGLATQHRQDQTETKRAETISPYSSTRYWIGNGQGDLTKGLVVCRRVSELSARTDLAKQIRVLVKEHMIDRVRERSGRTMEQDIELTREEVVQEYLVGVKIVDRQIDEERKICTATAVMLKPPVSQPLPEGEPTSIR